MRLVIKETFKVIQGDKKPEDPQPDPGAWDAEPGSGYQTGEEALEAMRKDKLNKPRLIVKNK